MFGGIRRLKTRATNAPLAVFPRVCASVLVLPRRLLGNKTQQPQPHNRARQQLCITKNQTRFYALLSHIPVFLHFTMNSTSMHLNNTAIDALHTGDLATGFNILLKACARQSRMSSKNHNHGVHKHKPGIETHSHIFEYIFEDCSNILMRNTRKNVVSPQNLLCLKFLRIGSPLSNSQLDSMCSCGVSWVLGYNLSILCAFVGLRIPDSGCYYLRKAMALLGPIQRTVLRRTSSSLFWTTLKLAVLNNYAFVLRECSLDTHNVTSNMKILLRSTAEADEQQLDPIDAINFQRSLDILNMNDIVAAAA